MKNICIISTNAGQGHRATERAIREVLADTPQLNIQSVEVYEDLLAPFDLGARTIGITAPEIYNRFVLEQGRSGLLWILLCLIARVWVGWNKNRMIRHLQSFWRDSEPDVVVSVVPLFNGILAESLAGYDARVPYLTVISDFCEITSGVWIQSQLQIVATGTDRANEQARKFGLPDQQILELPGMVVSPRFYDKLDGRMPASPQSPSTALLIFGGHAPERMARYARQLAAIEDLSLICVCGKNENLAGQLREQLGNRHRVYGFVNDLTELYARADIVIGKPGPGVITEALIFGKPLLLERNRITLMQERYNAKWVLENGFGKLFRDEQDLVSTFEEMRQPESWQALTRQVNGYQNDAVFFVRQVILELLDGKRVPEITPAYSTGNLLVPAL